MKASNTFAIKIIINIPDEDNNTSFDNLSKNIRSTFNNYYEKELINKTDKQKIALYGHLVMDPKIFTGSHIMVSPDDLLLYNGIKPFLVQGIEFLSTLPKKPSDNSSVQNVFYTTLQRLLDKTNAKYATIDYADLLRDTAERLEAQYENKLSIMVIDPIKMSNKNKLNAEILNTKHMHKILFINTTEDDIKALVPVKSKEPLLQVDTDKVSAEDQKVIQKFDKYKKKQL